MASKMMNGALHNSQVRDVAASDEVADVAPPRRLLKLQLRGQTQTHAQQSLDSSRTTGTIRRAISKISNSSKKDRRQLWHQEIDRTVNGSMPVQTSKGVFRLYPWGRLRQHTDELVGRLKLTSSEMQSLLLYDLIDQHPDTVTAISACSHLLSQQALHDLLATVAEQKDSALYLQAYVAAAHGNYENFPEEADERWAFALADSNYLLLSERPEMDSLQDLLELTTTLSLPRDLVIQRLAKKAIISLCSNVQAVFHNCRILDPPDWVGAAPIATCLASAVQTGDMSPFLLQILDENVAEWRIWASWKPNIARLKLWRKSAEDWPNAMWEFLAPDFGTSGQRYPSALNRLIAEGSLISWLEGHHVVTGAGLYFSDARGIATFSDTLLSVMDLVCQNGGLYAAFLRHLLLDKKLGLDQHALGIWIAAKDHFIVGRAPFFDGLLHNFSRKIPIRDIEDGLNAMNSNACRGLREYLHPQLSNVALEIARSLVTSFLAHMRGGKHWLPHALTLNRFRRTLSSCLWLANVSIPGIDLKHVISDPILSEYYKLDFQITSRQNDLHEAVKIYVTSMILSRPLQDDAHFRLIRSLESAFTVADYVEISASIACITRIPLHLRENLITSLRNFSAKHTRKLGLCVPYLDLPLPSQFPPQVCRRVIRLAAEAVTRDESAKEAWSSLAQPIVKSSGGSVEAFQQTEFTNRTFNKYRRLILNLEIVFGGSVPGLSEASMWTKCLTLYSATLESLRQLPNSTNALHSMYTCNVISRHTGILGLLQSLEDEDNAQRLGIKQRMVCEFTSESDKAEAVSQAVVLLSSASQLMLDRCQVLFDLLELEPMEEGTASVQLEVWKETMNTSDQKLLGCIGKVLGLARPTKPILAKDYFAYRFFLIMSKVQALEELKQRLKIEDAHALSGVLVRLGIEDTTSPLEDELDRLPVYRRNHMEQIDEKTMELYFPLDGMTDLRRLAMGVKQGENLVLRLQTNEAGSPDAYCVHVVNSATDLRTIKHKPIIVASTTDPARGLQCEGRDTRLGYLIIRRAFRILRQLQNQAALAKLYGGIETALAGVGTECLVCETSLRSNSYRSVICSKPKCHTTYIQSSLDVRLADVRTNVPAVELLLCAVHAAASTKQARAGLDLLPSCPNRLNNPALLTNLLDRIPDVQTSLQALADFTAIKDTYSLRAELLLSWTCNSFRGFVTEATGGLKIPNMPGVKQFVVADSSPEINAAFSKWDHVQPRTVLFHGTTYDRLYAILHLGLLVCSNTALQAHGAASGPGIYLAENPSLSMSYAGTGSLQPNFAQKHMDYMNRSVLLGVEYAGYDAHRGSGVHVAPDASKCCVRYIFLCPPGFAAPVATHIVPAMLSNFNTLRAGARSQWTLA